MDRLLPLGGGLLISDHIDLGSVLPGLSQIQSQGSLLAGDQRRGAGRVHRDGGALEPECERETATGDGERARGGRKDVGRGRVSGGKAEVVIGGGPNESAPLTLPEG